LLDKEILLESGTNEFEVLVFDVADHTFGINVAKVREVLPTPSITTLAKAHPSVRGVFRLRDLVIPCVSLLDHLGVEAICDQSENTIILSDFNQQQTAFLVDKVDKIYRISWETVLAVPPLMALAQTPVTSVARLDERLVVMLDFEMIIDQVTDQRLRASAISNPLNVPRHELRILLADDSPTVRQAVSKTLSDSGYTRLEVFENGQAAWQWITDRFEETGNVAEVADLLISDVEMPLIERLRLTKLVKDHPQLRQIPVLLYSSIVTPDNHKKGAAVGADDQIAKPQLADVVEIADRLVTESQTRSTAVVDTAAPAALEETAAPEKIAVPEEIATESPNVAAVATRQDASADVDTLPDFQDPLWKTFLTELADHLDSLKPSLAAVSDARSVEAIQASLRILHTIKSAAMVVPVHAVTQTTHEVESLLTQALDKQDDWPGELIEEYVVWLGDLVDPSANVSQLLRDGGELVGSLASSTTVSAG